MKPTYFLARRLAPSSSLAEITPVEIKLTNTKVKHDKDPSTGELQ